MTCVVGLIVINCENDLISDVLGETHVCRIKRRLLLTNKKLLNTTLVKWSLV